MIQDHKQFDLFGRKIFEKAVVRPPFRFFYAMPDEACFYYLCKGRTSLYAQTEKIEMETSEGVVLQCGTYFGETLKSDTSDYCEAIAIHFPLSVLQMIYDTEFPDFLLSINEVAPLKLEKKQASELLKNYIDSLEFYFENPVLVNEEILKLKLKELILLLARTDEAAAVKELLAQLFTTVSFEFKEIIEANIFNNLSVPELAQLTHLSLSSFKREFSKQYGNTPARYIKERRLKKAAKLLEATELRISEIAFDCGFSDLPHFSRTFQKKYAHSPSAYRLNLKTNSLN